MSATLPFLSTPRVEPLILAVLRDTLPDVSFGTVKKQDIRPPYREVVLGAVPQQLQTPVSRWVSLWLEAYVIREDGTGDIDGGYGLANDVAHAVHEALPIGPIWDAQIAGGPVKQLDADDTAVTYMTLQLRVSLKHQ